MLAKLFFKNEGQIKTLPDKQMERICHHILNPQEILNEVLNKRTSENKKNPHDPIPDFEMMIVK